MRYITKKITDHYLVYVDYAIYNEEGQEINHSCSTKRIEATDALLPLGVAFNNECVYRRVKAFNPKVVFSVTNHIPFGVLESSYGKKYTMKINDVCILETVDQYESECFNVHNSIEGNSYDYQSHTIGTLLRDHIPVYSSAAAKVDIGEFTVSFYPRKITLDLHCLLANLVVAYDEQNIKDILIENMNQKYPDPPIPEPNLAKTTIRYSRNPTTNPLRMVIILRMKMDSTIIMSAVRRQLRKHFWW